MIEINNDVIEIKIDSLKSSMEEAEMRNDKLVFEKNEVEQVQDPFTILLRSIIYSKKITITQFKEMVKNYYIRLGANAKQIAQQPNNILRYIKSDKEITSKTFMLVIRNILQLEIKKFEVDFLNYGEMKNNKPKEEKYVINVLDPKQ